MDLQLGIISILKMHNYTTITIDIFSKKHFDIKLCLNYTTPHVQKTNHE